MDPSKNTDPYAVERGAGKSTKASIPSTDRAAGAVSAKFETTVQDGVHVIRLSSGEVLDAFEIETLGQEIQAYLHAADSPRAVIDLTNVRLLSSAALGMLLSLKSQAQAKGGGLCLAHVRDELKQVFKLTKLNKVLKIHKDLDAAVRSF